MRHDFEMRWLLPAATLLAAAPAAATTYFTLEQAQHSLFPGQAMAPQQLTLTPAQAKAVQAASGVRVRTPELRLWRAADGGWFYLDQVLGKHEFITYALALDMLHFSPEPRVVELVLESAHLLGQTDEANFYALRYQAAFPAAYNQWQTRNATK